MHDDPRRFSTHAFPDALRQAALNEALSRADIHGEAPTPPATHLALRSSPLGSVFITLATSPLTLRAVAKRLQIGRASCRERSVDLGGRRIIKKKNDSHRN